jgi:hypothetical protein
MTPFAWFPRRSDVTEVELRLALLARLSKVAARLPNGLLQRLVSDAEFFHDWNLCKKRARASARLSQFRSWQEKAEERYWKGVRR